MRRNLLIIIALFTIACKQTPQQKAEALVKSYLDSTLDDPGSYEPVSFRLDTVFAMFYSSDEYSRLWQKQDAAMSIGDFNSSDSIAEIIKYKEAHYRPKDKIVGLFLIHKYRTHNSLGAKVLKIDTFSFNKSFTKMEPIHTK